MNTVIEPAHFQDTRSRKGSPSQTSIAQKAKGSRIQFNPAAAICAKSSSVYGNDQRRYPFWDRTRTYNKSLVMLLELVNAASGCIGPHELGECELVYGIRRVFLIKSRGYEGFCHEVGVNFNQSDRRPARLTSIKPPAEVDTKRNKVSER